MRAVEAAFLSPVRRRYDEWAGPLRRPLPDREAPVRRRAPERPFCAPAGM